MTSTFSKKQRQDSNSGLLTLESCLSQLTPPPRVSAGFQRARSGVCDYLMLGAGRGEEKDQGMGSLGLVLV